MSMGISLGSDLDLAFKKRAFYYFYAWCFYVCVDKGFRQNRDAFGRSQVPLESA